MNREEKIEVSLSEEDVQNVINCYEKDIEYIKQLEEKIDKAIEYIENHIIATETEEVLLEILKGESNG